MHQNHRNKNHKMIKHTHENAHKIKHILLFFSYRPSQIADTMSVLVPWACDPHKPAVGLYGTGAVQPIGLTQGAHTIYAASGSCSSGVPERCGERERDRGSNASLKAKSNSNRPCGMWRSTKISSLSAVSLSLIHI